MKTIPQVITVSALLTAPGRGGGSSPSPSTGSSATGATGTGGSESTDRMGVNRRQAQARF